MSPVETGHESQGDASKTPKSRRYWWLKRIAAGVVLLCLVLAGLHWAWGYYAFAQLDAELGRIHASGDPYRPADFDLPPIPDHENKAIVLRQAAAAMQLTDDDRHWLSDLPFHGPKTAEDLDRLRRIVAGNAEAFELVRQAWDRPGVNWGVIIAPCAYNTPLPDFAPQFRLNLLLRLKSCLHARTGDHEAAVASLLDSLRGTDTALAMPHALVQGCSWPRVSRLALTVENFTPDLKIAGVTADLATKVRSRPRPARRETVEALAIELLDDECMIRAHHVETCWERLTLLPLIAYIRGNGEERDRISAQFAQRSPNLGEPYDEESKLEGPGLSARIHEYAFRPAHALGAARALRLLHPICAVSKEVDWQQTTNAFNARDARIVELDTWLETNTGWQEETYRLEVCLLALGPFGSEKYYQALAYRRMAAVAIAIRLYELDHGARPTRLQDLVPANIPYTPTDPFTDGLPITYRPTGEAPMLYCVGANGVDDGGKTIEKRWSPLDRPTPDIVFFLLGDGDN